MDETNLDRLIYNKPGHLIRRLHQIATTVFLEETEGFDTTPVQYGALAAVRAYPGIDQLRLANAIGFDRTTIAGVVERLEGKGLVSRSPGIADRRTKLLFLTDKGEALLMAIFPGTERAQGRSLIGLNDAEKVAFVEMLQRVVAANNEVSRVPISSPPPRLTSSRRPPA
ncbi:transcriptional regulator MarR family protein [Cupriavidus basilensis OR16]|uniref:Transcriptional regulator MarR family protein n=1 Tax=Cupriavidus basilensis OR16 TaxID=1127483 RepID=H1S8P7_9BURK|nr:MarR family transcriptional regulator [Cupriavidus basilensis]EHP41089.1 transcriptional regulator MarR family protein [Cupriavidus basilensis OR16]